MKKVLCVLASVVSLNAASVCVDEHAALVLFKQEMGRMYQNNVESDDFVCRDLSANETLQLRENWCHPCGCGWALKKLAQAEDSEISKKSKDLFSVMRFTFFESKKPGDGGIWQEIISQIKDLQDHLF